ncbi:MAG: hypothetical protein CFE36_12075 [Sphingomonadaceae bacterium PASS1]|nr:MAG: hypothetical protein CFE36_12075 [Sphingomonadaceae bacterium PASS1]
MKEINTMLKLNINDLVHIMKQIKIAENHTATGQLVDHMGNPLNNLVPAGLRTVTGEYNNLVNLNAGASDQLMPRLSNPTWNAAEANPRTGASTSYQQLSGSVYDSQPRIISNLIADQSLTNPVAVIAALAAVGITSGPLYSSIMTLAEAARMGINDALAADKALFTADTALAAAGMPTSGAAFDDAEAARLVRDTAHVTRDTAVSAATAQLALAGIEMDGDSILMPNVMTDLGSTAPLNGFMTLFGQFFDHGLDGIGKGGAGTVFIPLQPDDPLYVPGSPTNFMVLTRATNLPGADGILGTADDVREATNGTTAWIDLSQNYASHESHQVFLREYKLVDGKPAATGMLLAGVNGGPPTWADVKLQAKEMLGIELSDMDVHSVPLLATDLYGNFIPGANGFAQLVTGPTTLVEGNPAAPVAASSAISTGAVFLADIAHAADPKAGQTADADTDVGNAQPVDARGNSATYDNEMLNKHYIAGDGRANENIGLTAVHHVFHSEHNNRVDQIKAELIANGDVTLLNEWLSVQIDAMPTDTTTLEWNGERLFQASRYTTEQVYQHLVFEEFVRTIQPNIDAFVFSNTVDIDPAITAEFAHAVYRFGHSQLNETVDRLSADGQTSNDIGLIEAFLNPVAFEASGATVEEAAGAIIRGMTRQVGNEIDEFVTGALRNNLVGLPLDLAAINIARGRDAGVGSLNQVRADFFAKTGDTMLEPYSSWFDFALAIKTPASVINFIAAYGQHQSILNAVTVEDKRDAAINLVMGGPGAPADRMDFLNSTGAWAGAESGLNLVDFWIGGLAEKKMAFGGLLGSTFSFVFEVQMENLQAGDRFYYISRSQGTNLLNQLEGDSWAELAMRNTDLHAADATHLPSSIFLTPSYILELNQSLQGMADPVHDNMIMQAMNPMVVRKDIDGDGADDYIRYTGVDHVVLGGTEVNDTLLGGEGDDTLWGDAGDDRIDGGQGIDHAFGGAGDDVITDGGTPMGAADVIHGDDGNDVISSGDGLDLLFGGRGTDFIFGGRDGKSVTAGEGNDFAQGGAGASVIMGNEGDDWLEGGNGFDGMAGDNSELFFNSRIIGHDVLNGRANDTDYDGESGDDIMFQGVGIQRNAGMAGFDWAINKNNPVAADSHMGIPIFANQAAFTLRDRFDLVEGLSGWKMDDTLTGRNKLAGAVGAPGAGAIVDPNAPFLSLSSALTEDSVTRIDGFSPLVSHLARQTLSTSAGETITVLVRDAADVVFNGNVATNITDGAHDIILGGGGNDVIEGDGGNDILDGDRWLNVRIAVADENGDPMGSAEDMNSQVVDLQGKVMFGGRIISQLMIDRALNPGQLSIVREILDGSKAGDQDVAVYRDVMTNYSFVRNADGSTTVTHNAVLLGNETDGEDRLFNMEKMRFSDGNGGTVTYDINAVVPVPATGAPTISDTTPIEGQVLTVDLTTIIDPNGVINPTIQWQSSTDGITWVDIAGATEASFTATQAQVGSMVRVEVAWFDLTGTPELLLSAATTAVADLPEAATGAPIISDTTPAAGQTLTIDTATIADANGVGPLSHQWQISTNNGTTWTNIAQATGTSYTPTTAQIGSLLKVVTTFRDITTNTLETLTSAVTAAITQGPIAATGAPVISDLTPTETQALTLNVSSIADANGLGTLSYQWQSSTNNGTTWTNIAGATAASFTPVQAQVGTILRVAASFTDGIGTVETLTSSVTGVVGDNFVGVPVTARTFTGTAGDDIANGADATNVLGGSDTMSGLAGNDILNGRAGNDVITGGAGNDTINGGANNDTAVYAGASSNFTLSSNGTTITVTDNTGAEGVDAVTLVETLRFNGVDHTVVTGTAAANTQTGGAAAEAIFGLAGNDTIDGAGGNDLIYAGDGIDLITQASATGGRDFVDGGVGEDTFTITTDTTTAENFVIYTRAAALTALTGLTLNANTEIVITRNGTVMAELDNIEEIIVSTLRVTSPGGANGGTVSGDRISVVGDFNQTSLNFNTITIDGNTGNDTVDISALSSAHRIVFTSNGGQDTIVGTLRPQDIVNMDPNAVTPSHLTTALPMAEVTPVVVAMDAPAPAAAPAVAMNAPAPVAQVQAPAMAAAAPVAEFVAPVAEVLANVSAPILDQQVQGGSASDDLAGGEGDDSVAGGSGDDYLAGMLGDDRLSGGSGNDYLDGGDGDDALSGGSGNDYLDGNAGDDELTGGTGNDYFAFGNGDTVNDFVLGTDLIDVSFMGVTAENFAELVSITAVRGGALVTIGTESMMIANANAAALTSANFGLQNAGNAAAVEAPAAPVVETPAAPVAEAPAAPVVEAPAAPVVETPAAPVVEAPAAPVVETPAAPVLEVPTSPTVEDQTSPMIDDTLPVAGSDDLIKPVEVELEVEIERVGTRHSDVMNGGSLDDALSGGRGSDILSGMAGDDVLNGGKGSDKLFGGAGQDTLFGGKGMDYLDGGEGADVLSGGKGSDTFKFGDDDMVLDFKSGEDLIDLSSLGVTASNFAEMVTMSRQGSMITLNVGDESMNLLGSKSIDLDDFLFAEENEAESLLSEALSIVSREDMGRIGSDDRPHSDDSGHHDSSSMFVDDYSDMPLDLFKPVEHDLIVPMI